MVGLFYLYLKKKKKSQVCDEELIQNLDQFNP